MTDNKFVDFIFEPDVKSFSIYKLKLAYRSLAKGPQQLFTLFTDKDLSTTFLSAFEIYGKRLAVLLDDFPIHFGTTSEDCLSFGKDPLSSRLLEEVLGAFLFSLLANDFPDAAPQQSMADIVMAVIKISKPGGALGLLGAKLGDFPSILGRLIGHGQIGELSQKQPASFASLASNNTTLDAWARVAALNRVGQCLRHLETSQGICDWEQMKNFLQSFPCEECPAILDASESPLPRQRNINSHGMNSGIRAFDSLLGQHLGPWKVVISGRALRDLKEAVHCGNSDHIQESLLAIASGEWIRKSLRRSVGDDTRYRVPIYRVGCKGNVIIWQVDVAFDERHDHNMQVVKVWAICAYADVEDMCGWVIQAQQAYTDARVAACQTINLKAVKGTLYPAAVISPGFPEDSCDEELTGVFGMNPETPLTAADQAITEGSPILGKFYSLTTTVMENIHPEAALAVFPVDPSKEEFHIINHFKSPAFILGRSGTGKTTCLIYKLASRYLSSKYVDEAPVRQLLLTRSKDLAQKLKLYTKRLINTRLGIIAGDQQGEDGNAATKKFEEDTTQDLLSLEEEDFPVVCTFNHFLRLLENLVRTHDRRNARGTGALKRASQPVNFITFSLEYWQRLPTALTRRIPMDLAFIDIMGVIKGSASLASNLEPLSRDAYIARRWKLAPNFTTDSDRKAVYTLYEHYEKIKMGRGEVDDTDRVIRVLEALKKDPELFRTVEMFLDEVYVDEVQDQRPLEIELLLTLIRDPWGIHFAGDTAQSISKDSLFRFANAKALFYTRFNDLPSTARKQSWLIPTLLPLSHNYRSHKGILAVASVLMDLLYTAFPELVDKLPPEIGDQIGPTPTLFIGSGLVSTLHGTEASAETDSKGNPTDKDPEKTAFGGLRVILVRDEKTQYELQRKVPTSTLVLTILQSKGMEFDDVFLYNFFSTSSYSSNFKVLGDLLRERHSLEAGELTRYANWKKVDSILCSELKHLYVAITRAQTRLWIVESKEDVALPVINLFNKIVPTLFPERYPNPLLNVIRECEFENVSELRKLFHSTDQTTPAEWRELAYELITKNAYIQFELKAVLCFRNAKDKVGEALANAYIAELRGMEHRAHGLRNEFTADFEEACQLFLKAGRISKAVECQEAIGNTTAAAELLSENGRHEEAAWLFTKAGEPKKAAREYAELGKHETVLATCFYAGLYNELAVYLKSFAPKINSNCRKQYSRLCYLLLIQEKFTPQLQATVTLSLGSKSEQESVFREFGMMNHVFHLYKSDKRFKDAYEVAVNIGFLEEALGLANDHGLLPLVSHPILRRVFDYVQAGNLLNQATHKRPTGRPNSEAILSLDRGWKLLIEPLSKYRQHGETPNRSNLEDGVLRGFFDLLVTTQTPNVKAIAPGLTKLPLGFIGGAISILKTIITERTLPPPALLYLGIFETQTHPGEYIALPRSTGIDPKLKFPIQYVNVNTVCESRLIFNTISAALSFITEISQKQWKTQIINDVFQGRGDDGKLTSAKFSANLQALLSINLLFSNLETLCSPPSWTESVIFSHQQFWQNALIRQITFISSYEQDATVFAKAKYELESTTPDFKYLYSNIKHHFLSRLQPKSRTHPQTLFRELSYLLQQLQVAVYFDIETSAMKSIIKYQSRPAVKLVTLAQNMRINTTPGDFPWNFYENVHRLLSELRQVQNSKPHQLFYSPSVLSLYEELITLLILLTRPIYFVIPRSWEALHLAKFARIPRSTSKCGMLWYQRILVTVVVNFCELVRHIEDTASCNLAKTDTLARRSLYLLVISIINADTTYTCGYREMWNQVQKVFAYKSLKAEPFLNRPAKQLLQNIVKAFTFYDGKDSLRVIVADGYDLPDKFAGLSLKSLGIVAVRSSIPQPQKGPLGPANTSLMIREINSAYIITQLWRAEGPQFVQRMKLQREAAHLITVFWRINGPRFVQQMKLRREAAHLITVFWRINGPRFVRRMQSKRERYEYERLVQRQKPKACQNCCILHGRNEVW